MDEKRKTYLLKLVRGKDLRRALHAIAELRSADVRAAAEKFADSLDEQRQFQLRVARIMLAQGVQGLVESWAALGSVEMRAHLVSEIGQFLDRWTEPAVNELMLAALEDSSRDVQVKGVWALLYLREPARRKAKPRSESERRYLEATAALRAALSASQRARITAALATMLERHASEKYPVLAQIVELLGYSANSSDAAVIEALEALRSQAGEPHTVSYERVQQPDFEWYEKEVLAKRGDDPKEIIRIKYTPTGLLDAKLLEETLARIRQGTP
jgi:hypothetical protein